ncbi:MAG: ribonucleotide reductase subunit alpha, partial [Eggerthellaceae bacterium]|nr:ribonucleotide reductase subunit alpha [Eggerthellaceae bacterium]
TTHIMRDLGIRMDTDASFGELVDLLNKRHGLDSMPAVDSLLFRAAAREDADRFVEATLGELKLPAVRMRMEENFQGYPLLCVSAQTRGQGRLSDLRKAFVNGGVLVLQDIDMWSTPSNEIQEDKGNFLTASLSRGAREAIELVRSAVESPDVFVLATSSLTGEIEGYFLDLLEPLSVIDIDYPTPEERIDLWMEIARDHPSLRSINLADLVRLSAHLPRYDIYMAAREAIEDAYKQGLILRRYQPVTRDNLFDKLAAYQPLESKEYKELEEAVLDDFRSELDHLDDMLNN